MLSKKAERRLTKLVEYMESLPRESREHFDMGYWFDHYSPFGDHHGLRKKDRPVTRRDLNLCGTTACALGWAATIPSFRRAGLHMKTKSRVPTFRDNQYFAAAMEFFDIDRYQAEALFDSDVTVNTPKQWARRARKLMRRWKQDGE